PRGARVRGGHASGRAADRVGEILQAELGLSPAETAQQVTSYRAALAHEKSILMGESR
ncbi:FAD-dependent oxidoreductase, partial [Variovorax sp. CT11-76]